MSVTSVVHFQPPLDAQSSRVLRCANEFQSRMLFNNGPFLPTYVPVLRVSLRVTIAMGVVVYAETASFWFDDYDRRFPYAIVNYTTGTITYVYS